MIAISGTLSVANGTCFLDASTVPLLNEIRDDNDLANTSIKFEYAISDNMLPFEAAFNSYRNILSVLFNTPILDHYLNHVAFFWQGTQLTEAGQYLHDELLTHDGKYFNVRIEEVTDVNR